jgi:hypothetical protein
LVLDLKVPFQDLRGMRDMLRPGDQPTQLQKWYDRLAPLAAEARGRLRAMDAGRLARRSGCTLDADGTLRMTMLWHAYAIQVPDFAIRRADTGQTPTAFTQALLLTYLVTADGTPPSGRWIAYRDLPGGMFYAQAFRGYAENRLARDLGTDGADGPGNDGLDAFRVRATRLGGEAIAIGNAGYAFQLLPRARLAAVYWLGDEDFPSRASVLFEDTAPHYLSTDGLAVLGSHLVNALVSDTDPTGLRKADP